MEITLLAVGKTNITWIKHGIEEYAGRLKRYVKFSMTYVADVKNTRNLPPKQQKDQEGQQILNELHDSDFIVLLDEHGKELSSMEFASWMEKSMASGRKRIVFVVGGPYGFSEAVYAKANAKISLSRMTFNHEMVRLFFTEQIYRAMTILKGEPYHHE